MDTVVKQPGINWKVGPFIFQMVQVVLVLQHHLEDDLCQCMPFLPEIVVIPGKLQEMTGRPYLSQNPLNEDRCFRISQALVS